MDIRRLNKSHRAELEQMLNCYKSDIGESPIVSEQMDSLLKALNEERIQFYGGFVEEKLVAMSSISVIFSTFSCSNSGIFEDFYVMPDYRKKGYARILVNEVLAACKAQGLDSLWVGCSDSDLNMYKSLGFEIPLGNLLTWVNE